MPLVLSPLPRRDLIPGTFDIVILWREHFFPNLISESPNVSRVVGKRLIVGFDLLGRILNANE